MKRGRTKTKLNISVDADVLKEAQALWKEMGLKQSTFINMVIKSFVQSKTRPMAEVYEEIGETLFKEMSKKKKE